MNSFFLINLTVHVIALTLLVLSRRSAPDLKRIALVFLLGSFSASLVQWSGYHLSRDGSPQIGFTLVAAIVTVASWSHFLIFLAAPRFTLSANYWCFQGALVVSGLLSSSLMSTAQINSATSSFILTFASSALVTASGLVLFFVFIQKNSNIGVVQRFRAHSARKIMLWTLALSLLLVLSLPITPAVATTSATCCSCFASIGIQYVINERRLFLNDCARQALSAPGEPVTDSAIALASSSLEALGDLLSPASEKRALKTSASMNPDQAILAELKSSNAYQDEISGLFESLLSAEGEPHFEVLLDTVRPNLLSLSFLSRTHFGVDIIGNSFALMELLGVLREQGDESRLTVLQGERGVGKKLFMRALHNLRGNSSLEHQYLDERDSVESILRTTRISNRAAPLISRKTLAISIPAQRQKECVDVLEQILDLQAGNTDVILLIEDTAEKTVGLNSALIEHALVIKIPPLRERLEDLLLQSLWFIDRYSSEHNLKIKGVTAAALRAALIEPWHLNSQEIVDTVTIALSLQNTLPGKILDSFVVSPRSHAQNSHSYRSVQEQLKLKFAQAEDASPHIAKDLGISSEFALALAHQYKQEQIKADPTTNLV